MSERQRCCRVSERKRCCYCDLTLKPYQECARGTSLQLAERDTAKGAPPGAPRDSTCTRGRLSNNKLPLLSRPSSAPCVSEEEV